jgi:hypothetical protein
MSEKEPAISEQVKEVRTYMMGDTGLGPEDPQKDPSFRPARITQIAGCRRAFLAGQENNSAREAVRELWSNPGQSIEELPIRSRAVCATIVERTRQICKAADLDDHSAESYMAATLRGCDRLQTAVREAMAECEGQPIREVLDRVWLIAMDVQRWHEISEDDPDVRRRP